MHGTIFVALRKFFETRYGTEAWADLLRQAEVEHGEFMPFAVYSDREAKALIDAAARRMGRDVQSVLEDFGRFLGPEFIRTYWSLVPDDWRTLDLIEHTDETIHRLIRLGNPNADPPQIQATRTRDDEVTVVYTSARKMCGLACGIVMGIADHYGERVEIHQTSCMLRGDSQCRLHVRLLR